MSNWASILNERRKEMGLTQRQLYDLIVPIMAERGKRPIEYGTMVGILHGKSTGIETYGILMEVLGLEIVACGDSDDERIERTARLAVRDKLREVARQVLSGEDIEDDIIVIADDLDNDE
ncbi:MAG: hypothetical protein GY835_05585 [bacterium]|nr:hypothetical protein [bacterium]